MIFALIRLIQINNYISIQTYKAIIILYEILKLLNIIMNY